MCMVCQGDIISVHIIDTVSHIPLTLRHSFSYSLLAIMFFVGTFFLFFSTLFTTVFSQYNGTTGFTNVTSTAENITVSDAPYWLQNIKHQGVAAFRSDSTYQVFRNVKTFGAKGTYLPSTIERNLLIR